MPRMNGLALTQNIKEIDNNMVVIIATGSDETMATLTDADYVLNTTSTTRQEKIIQEVLQKNITGRNPCNNGFKLEKLPTNEILANFQTIL